MSGLAKALQGLRPPSKELTAELNTIRCRIEGRLYNPTGARVGAKYPMRYMLGRDMAAYYPAAMNIASISHLIKQDQRNSSMATINDQAQIFSRLTREHRQSKGKTEYPRPKQTGKNRKR